MFGHVRPTKIQINMRIHVVCPKSSMGVVWIGKDAKFLRTNNEDWSDCAGAHMSEGTFSQVTTQMIEIYSSI